MSWAWLCARVCAWGSGMAMGAVGGAILGVAPNHLEGSQLGAVIGGFTGLYCGILWLQAMTRWVAIASGIMLGAALGFGCAAVSYMAVLVQAAVLGYPLMGVSTIVFLLLGSLLVGALSGLFNTIIVANTRGAWR